MARASRDRDVDRFGRWADHYDRSYLQRVLFTPVHDAMLAQATAACPVPATVLDVGCGTGRLLHKAAACFPSARLTGIDAAADMVRVARAGLPEGAPVQIVEARAEQVPFPDGSFDLVLTTMSFHHWADQRTALRDLHRVLAPGGVFVLADLLATGPAVLLRAGWWGRFNTPAGLAQMLRGAGFDVDRLVRVPRVPGCVRVVLARPRAL
jgi:ubiquinone/menaquinone biosynthesis C-methylase UbiE